MHYHGNSLIYTEGSMIKPVYRLRYNTPPAPSQEGKKLQSVFTNKHSSFNKL